MGTCPERQLRSFVAGRMKLLQMLRPESFYEWKVATQKDLGFMHLFTARYAPPPSLLAFFPLMLLLMLFCVCLLELKRYFLEVIHIHRCYLYSAVAMQIDIDVLIKVNIRWVKI